MIVLCIFIFFFTPMFWIFSIIEIKKTPFFTKFVIINLYIFFIYCFLFFKPYFFGETTFGLGLDRLPITFLIHTILMALLCLMISKKYLQNGN